MNEREHNPDELRATVAGASDAIFSKVYTELRQLASAKMARERSDHTLNATALVHEAYLRLGGSSQKWDNRGHFFGAAAEAMRRILVEHARKRNAEKRGGDLHRTVLHESKIAGSADGSDELLAVDEALEELEKEAPQAAQVVKLRYFAGLSMAETAEALEISLRTAERQWTFARAWLFSHIGLREK